MALVAVAVCLHIRVKAVDHGRNRLRHLIQRYEVESFLSAVAFRFQLRTQFEIDPVIPIFDDVLGPRLERVKSVSVDFPPVGEPASLVLSGSAGTVQFPGDELGRSYAKDREEASYNRNTPPRSGRGGFCKLLHESAHRTPGSRWNAINGAVAATLLRHGDHCNGRQQTMLVKLPAGAGLPRPGRAVRVRVEFRRDESQCHVEGSRATGIGPVTLPCQ